MKLQYLCSTLILVLSLSLSACVPPPPATEPTTQQGEQQPTTIATSLSNITDTVPPTAGPTATSTSVPPPFECNHPATTENVFLQLVGVNEQSPFYGPLNDANFLCQGVYDNFHTGPVSVRIEYKSVDENVGFWGIGTPKGYDATLFSQICFWAYAQNPNQAFKLKLKDTSGTEKGIVINVAQGGQWTSFCKELSEFSEQGVKLNVLENVNLGFEKPTKSATVWVDDFEFK